MIGFVVLRHVNSQRTNRYWNHCYRCIRRYYPENHILFIDDNSMVEFVSTEQVLTNTTTINSAYPGRGELLPYIYYLQYPLFETAVFLHDSVFVNQFVDFTVDRCRFLWDFRHEFDLPLKESAIIQSLGDPALLDFYWRKHEWRGCFGGMVSITHEYLKEVNDRYDLTRLLPIITDRAGRMLLERVIACILQKNSTQQPLLGDIHVYCPWGITFEEKDKFQHLPLIKVWSGR
jgi:hypothetical protein